MATLGKRCPGCGNFVQKTSGCDTMMCGTNAHGKVIPRASRLCLPAHTGVPEAHIADAPLHPQVQDALRNGGCALVFSYKTLQRSNDGHGYTDHDGNFHKGSAPKTNRQVLLPGYDDGAKFWPDTQYYH